VFRNDARADRPYCEVIGSSSRTFVGGMRGPRLSWLEPGANASWPLVELRLAEGRGSLRVRVPGIRSLVQRWLPSFDFDPADARVEVHKGWLGRGVRIEAPGRPSVIFWTSRPDDVIAAINREAALDQPSAQRLSTAPVFRNDAGGGDCTRVVS
jgi:hypothetical protein